MMSSIYLDMPRKLYPEAWKAIDAQFAKQFLQLEQNLAPKSKSIVLRAYYFVGNFSMMEKESLQALNKFFNNLCA